MSYKTILVMDKDDTPAGDLMSLPEFLDYINFHVESVNAKPEDIFVRLNTARYEDSNDYNSWISMAEIEFLVKE